MGFLDYPGGKWGFGLRIAGLRCRVAASVFASCLPVAWSGVGFRFRKKKPLSFCERGFSLPAAACSVSSSVDPVWRAFVFAVGCFASPLCGYDDDFHIELLGKLSLPAVDVFGGYRGDHFSSRGGSHRLGAGGGAGDVVVGGGQ